MIKTYKKKKKKKKKKNLWNWWTDFNEGWYEDYFYIDQHDLTHWSFIKFYILCELSQDHWSSGRCILKLLLNKAETCLFLVTECLVVCYISKSQKINNIQNMLKEKSVVFFIAIPYIFLFIHVHANIKGAMVLSINEPCHEKTRDLPI